MDNFRDVTNSVKIYKYRWVVLFVFCLFTVINFMQFLQFTIITNIITEYYGVETFLVDVTGLIFFVMYIILFLPISYLIERYNLRVTAIVSTGLTLAGCGVKLLCARSDRFFVVIIGQGLCAIGQVYMLSIPSKFASLWFGKNEVSTACAIAVLGTQLGAAMGSILPPFLVKSKDKTEIGENIHNMMIYNASICLAVFSIVVLFFRAKPPLPPSHSQVHLLEEETLQPPFFENCKILLKNKNYLLLLLTLGLANGLWNSFGILVNNIYINYFPEGENDIGIITLIAIIAGGCIGSIIFGFILDKTHQFKKTSVAVTFMSACTFIFVAYTLLAKSRIGTFVTIPLFGFFTASLLVISFEYTLEETYPIPESISCSILNATIFLFAIICTLAIEGLFVAIGYLNSFIVILVILLLCAFILLFVKPELRRRNANIDIQSFSESSRL